MGVWCHFGDTGPPYFFLTTLNIKYVMESFALGTEAENIQ